MGYVELHANSAFSFLRGAAQPETLVHLASMHEMPAIAVLDRDGVYGSARVKHAGDEFGVRGIVGAELTLLDGSVLPVLVRERKGYNNLCKLLTRMKLRSVKGGGAVAWGEVAEYAEGLVALTGGAAEGKGILPGVIKAGAELGMENHMLQKHRGGAAPLAPLVTSCPLEMIDRMLDVFGKENVYVEIQRHLVRGEGWMNSRLVEIAETRGLPLLATNGAAFGEREGRLLLDAFTCLRHHVTLDDAGTLLERNSERYLKSAEEMKALFRDLPEAVENSVRLADRLEFQLGDLGYEFPKFPVNKDETMMSVLREQTFAGARDRWGSISKKVRKQLEHELRIIGNLKFEGYFLIVKDIVDFARRTGVLVQGRGSAANSAVCYCLGITAVDAIKQELLFERFLSEGRHSWPDIDLDLPSGDRRESIIQEVYRKYAPRGAAMTANVITYRGRSSMREMGKVLGIPGDVLGRFSDLYGHGDFPHTLELEEQIEKAGMAQGHPRMGALVHLLQSVYGLPRHLGQHSGGMIISDQPLDNFVPLENASMPGRVVAQWDKDDCEDLGIIKVDLLGLGMMAAIQDTVEMCRVRGAGREFDLHTIPQDDPACYELMQKADTIGVFQIESRAQMATLPRLKPEKFYDLAIEVAIIRPGPIVGNMVHPFINRKHGREPIDYIHPRFEKVLKRTLGVPLFQEQVLQMAMEIADFTGSEAEELRRAISFNRSDIRMQKVITKLRTAMTKKNVEIQVQDRIENSIKSFALYGFPESHAISFALLAYVSVWLKVHRPAEFYTALLNNQPMGFYSPATLIKDAKRHGIRVRPVCVVESEDDTTVETDKAIRLGLRQVKGLSRSAAQRIIIARAEKPWASLNDFLQRTSINKDQRRVLAKVGALAKLSEHRRDALWRSETYLDADDLFLWKDTRTRLLNEGDANATVSPLTKMNAVERLQSDYDGLNLTTGPHPMSYIRAQLPEVWSSDQLEQGKHGDRVIIAGLVICRQRPGTAKGHLFVSLEDESGISNAFVPGPTFEKYRLVITQEPFLKLYGILQKKDDVTSVYTEHVHALEFATSISVQSHDFH